MSRTRSRPACACAAVPIGDHLLLVVHIATYTATLHRKEQRRPSSIGHTNYTELQIADPRTACFSD